VIAYHICRSTVYPSTTPPLHLFSSPYRYLMYIPQYLWQASVGLFPQEPSYATEIPAGYNLADFVAEFRSGFNRQQDVRILKLHPHPYPYSLIPSPLPV
jgi:hypothetical protein